MSGAAGQLFPQRGGTPDVAIRQQENALRAEQAMPAAASPSSNGFSCYYFRHIRSGQAV